MDRKVLEVSSLSLSFSDYLPTWTYLPTVLSMYLSISLSIYLSICLSVCLSVCLSLCLSVSLSLCLSVSLSLCLSVSLSLCLSVCRSVSLSLSLSRSLRHCLWLLIPCFLLHGLRSGSPFVSASRVAGTYIGCLCGRRYLD